MKYRNGEVECKIALIHNSSGVLEKPTILPIDFNFGPDSPTGNLSSCTDRMYRSYVQVPARLPCVVSRIPPWMGLPGTSHPGRKRVRPLDAARAAHV